MDASSSEVKAFDLIHGTVALRRRWKMVVAVTLAGGLLGVLLTASVAPIWESEVNIQVGTVPVVSTPQGNSTSSQALEDPRVLAKILESEAFRLSIPPPLRFAGSQPVRTQIVEVGSAATVAYLRVITRASTPEQATALAAHVLGFVKARHEHLFETATKDFSEWRKRLTRLSEELDAGVAELQSSLKGLRTERGDSATAVILQVQLETKQTRQLQIGRELRGLTSQVGTAKPTAEIGPPSVPDRPVWPRQSFFGAVGAALGLVAAVCLVLLLG